MRGASAHVYRHWRASRQWHPAIPRWLFAEILRRIERLGRITPEPT
jgi:hypothetical protein